MTRVITDDQKEFERAWYENEDIQTLIDQNEIDSEVVSLCFSAAWFMWKQAKAIKVTGELKQPLVVEHGDD